VRTGKAEAGKKHRLAAAKLFLHARQTLAGEIRAELMEAGSPHRQSRQPPRKVKSCRRKPWMSRANSFSRLQAWNPVRRNEYYHACINHNWRRATILFHLTE
jgi:hypothetical protein